MKIKITDLFFTTIGQEDYDHWQQNDIKIFNKVNYLINNIFTTPFQGIGKPEPLKYQHAGKWSRRITKGHRLIYAIDNSTLVVYQCRYHYVRE